jgi:hypothetical protein
MQQTKQPGKARLPCPTGHKAGLPAQGPGREPPADQSDPADTALPPVLACAMIDRLAIILP